MEAALVKARHVESTLPETAANESLALRSEYHSCTVAVLAAAAVDSGPGHTMTTVVDRRWELEQPAAVVAPLVGAGLGTIESS